MAQELIYTSAESGLKAGSRGFCTVAATDGIPPRMVTLMESLSGYRHTHAPAQQPHPGNPVNWSHLRTEAGESLLSRIADAGLDYSGRSNKIAHHLLLSPSEFAPTGPAAMSAATGNLISSWDRPPARLPIRSLAAGTVPMLPASAWHTMTGDAGWAGVLAAAAIDPAKPTVYVIFQASQNVFALIQEAMALLPPDARWRVAFSTFFTGVPPGMSCQWRCVLAGSREHVAVPPHNRVVRIDLTSTLGLAPETAVNNTLIQRARQAPAPSAAASSPAKSSPSTRDDQPQPHDPISHAANLPPVLPADFSDPWQQPPQLQTTHPSSPVHERVGEHHSPSRWPLWIVAGTIVLMLLGTTGWTLYTAARDSRSAEVVPTIDPAEAIERTDFDEIEIAQESTEPIPIEPVLPDSAPEKKDEPEMEATPATTEKITPSNPVKPDSKPSETTPSKPAPLEPTPLRLHYLLSPATWAKMSSPRSGWNGDREPLTVPIELPRPDSVIGLERIADGQMQRLANVQFQPTSGVLQLRSSGDALNLGVVKIATFAPNQIVLEPNYASRLGERLLMLKIADQAHLLTLHGAVTPQHGMDEPLTIRLNASQTITRPLGAIAPTLLANATLQLMSELPSGWTKASSGDSWTLRKPATTPTEQPPTSEQDIDPLNTIKRKPPQDDEISFRLDREPAAMVIVYRTSETTPVPGRFELAVTSEFSIGDKIFTVTLSRFTIEIP